MSAEPITTATTTAQADTSERGLLIAMALMVLLGVAAMLLITS